MCWPIWSFLPRISLLCFKIFRKKKLQPDSTLQPSVLLSELIWILYWIGWNTWVTWISKHTFNMKCHKRVYYNHNRTGSIPKISCLVFFFPASKCIIGWFLSPLFRDFSSKKRKLEILTGFLEFTRGVTWQIGVCCWIKPNRGPIQCRG